MTQVLRSLALVIVALSLWVGDAFACSSEFCPNDPSAVTFDGSSVLQSTSLFNVPASSGAVLLSYWYRSTTPPTDTVCQTMFSAWIDVTGPTTPFYVQVEKNLPNDIVLTVQAKDPSQFVASVTTFGVVDLPYDGNWHHVVVDVFTSGGFLNGQIALDGTTYTMANSGFYAFNKVDWSKVMQWTVGGPPPTISSLGCGFDNYTGDLAEVYAVVDGSVGSNGLTDAIVQKFRDPSTGKAVGLGANCIGPTGSVSNVCDRGDPCDFIFGPRPNAAPSYVLRKLPISSQPLLNGADTDPCLTDGKGQGCAPNK